MLRLFPLGEAGPVALRAAPSVSRTRCPTPAPRDRLGRLRRCAMVGSCCPLLFPCRLLRRFVGCPASERLVHLYHATTRLALFSCGFFFFFFLLEEAKLRRIWDWEWRCLVPARDQV
jgi:hypothetical protein